MTKTAKVAVIGIGAYLLYQYLQAQQPAPAEMLAPTNPASPIPLWVQQLEADAGYGGSVTTTDTIGSLLNIPQGPGGGPNPSGPVLPQCILGG